jgi:hypothetical protein
MPTKAQPWMRVYCWPLSPQSSRLGSSFAISDHLADLLDRAQGSEGGYSGTTGPGTGAGNQIIEASNLRWWHLNDESDKTRLCGYTVDTRYQPLNSIISGDNSINPPTGGVGLVWNVNSAHTDRWQTCLPDYGPACTAIRQTKLDMLEPTAARTRLPLPENQPFRVSLQLLGSAQGDFAGEVPWLRLSWGGGHVLNFDAGRAPEYGFRKGPATSGAAPTGYTARRTVPWAAALWHYSLVEFDVMYMGGRLCFIGADASTIYTDRPRGLDSSSTKGDREGQVNAVTGRAGPLSIESKGTAYVLRVQEIAHADLTIGDDGVGTESNHTGYFRRRYNSGQRPTALTGYASGYNPALKGGVEQSPDKLATVTHETTTGTWRGEGTVRCDIEANVKGTVALQPASWRDDVVEYGDGKAMRGHSSSLVHSLICNAPTRWRTVTSDDPVDIRPALDRAHETCADPNLQKGNQWTLEADRLRLRDIAAPTGGSLGENWQSYVGRNRRIRVEVAWLYDDGVRRAYGTPGGAPASSVSRLYGYQTAIGVSMPQVNKRNLTIDARDPLWRLQGKNAIINGEYAALDFLFARKLAAAGSGRKTVLYGADGVQYMLRTLLGDDEADALQVYYPGFAGLWGDGMRVLAGQWGLIEYLTYTNPPSGGGLIFPPPFGQDVLSWAGKIGEYDFAVLFYGPSQSDPTIQAPCYGNYFSYVHGRATTRLPDAVYLTGDEDLAILSAENQQVGEQDCNSWEFWGQVPGQNDLGGLMPALPIFSGIATIQSGSPIEEQNALLTWKRTSVRQGTQFYMPMVARRLAMMAYLLFWGTPARRVGVKCRGNEWLWWGDKVQIATDTATGESDPQLAYTVPGTEIAQTFRVMRARNDYQLGDKPNWETTLTLADQSTFMELAQWGAGS